MARMADLRLFAEEHHLTIVSIADMVTYRLQRDRLIEKVDSFELKLGAEGNKALFTAYLYRAIPGIVRREYVALALGDVAGDEPVPIRGHVGILVEDVFGCSTNRNRPTVQQVLNAIIRRGRGILLYLPSRETIESELASQVEYQAKPRPRDRDGEVREYGIGTQILLDLGVRRLQVISNNPHKLVGLDAWGFESVEQITLEEV
jgi:3,4-dihydroxy 2-butanone 4-phosphate synthase/GTP cyclohydrolase II